MNKIDRIKELVELLNKASDAYYNTGDTIMEDKEFDDLLDELKELEEQTEFILSNSPTHTVGAKVLSKLNKVSHDIPMLSLDKCHTTEELIDFVGNDKCYLTVKYDGLSTRLIFENGQLISAATRGNGVEGTDITEHVKYYENIPMTIPYKERFVIDGESIILNHDFQTINSKLPEAQQFKNSRNLASGTLNNLDMNIVKKRHMKFFAWRVIEGFDDIDSNYSKLCGAYTLGFEVGLITPHCAEHNDQIQIAIDWLKHNAERRGIQIDGIVMAKDSAKLSNQMGRTEKFFRHSIAYKFKDETYETELLGIEWTVGRTGTITPTAVFKPVEIDGTIVERASVHNVSVLTQLDLHVSDIIEVCKSNQIIPQIKRNISAEQRIDTDYIVVPATCPVCNGATKIIETDNSKILVCTNPDCAAKKLAQFVHFVSRNCMNIVGMSEATLERFISLGFLHEYTDIYRLKEHYGQLVLLDGFGTKSVDKLLNSIEESRHVKLENFINALGIPNIGLAAAKTISKFCEGDVIKFLILWGEDFNWETLDDFGEVMAKSINQYLRYNYYRIVFLIQELKFELPEENNDNSLDGLKFCITGSFSQSRDELKKKLESKGAKFVSSVSKNLDVLFVGNKAGSKLTKAQNLGVKVADEAELMNMIGG